MKLARWMLSQGDGSFSCSICESWHWVQSLKDAPTLRLLWSVRSRVCLAKWPAHQQGQVEWQVGVPCVWTVWSLPSCFACKELRCWEVVLQRCHLSVVPSFEEISSLSLWPVSLSFSPQSFPISCNIVDVKFPIYQIKIHTQFHTFLKKQFLGHGRENVVVANLINQGGWALWTEKNNWIINNCFISANCS